MGRLLHLLWDICRLRSGPQELPYSPRLLLIVCAFALALQMMTARLLGIEGDVLGAGLFSLTLNLLVVYSLLSLRGLRNRFVQSALALISCAAVFMLLNLVIVLLAGDLPKSPDEATSGQLLLGAISIPLLVWQVLVNANIWRHSLNVPFLAGIAIAFFWIVVVLALASHGARSPVT